MPNSQCRSPCQRCTQASRYLRGEGHQICTGWRQHQTGRQPRNKLLANATMHSLVSTRECQKRGNGCKICARMDTISTRQILRTHQAATSFQTFKNINHTWCAGEGGRACIKIGQTTRHGRVADTFIAGHAGQSTASSRSKVCTRGCVDVIGLQVVHRAFP